VCFQKTPAAVPQVGFGTAAFARIPMRYVRVEDTQAFRSRIEEVLILRLFDRNCGALSGHISNPMLSY